MKLILLVALITAVEFASCGKCILKTDGGREGKWSPFQKKYVKKLGIDVTYDCEKFDCHEIKDDEVVVEKVNKTGCRCHKEEQAFDCRCCLKLKRWTFQICIGTALEIVDPYKFSIFATFEGQVFARFSVPLKALADKYIPVCVPCLLPPPLDWLSPCFKFKFEVPSPKNNNVWKICGKIKLGIYVVPVWTIYTKCFEIPSKIDSMKIEGQTSIDEDVEVPAVVKVEDRDNMLAVICESNYKKEQFIACKFSRGGGDCPRPKFIIVDERISWQESKIDQSPFLVRLHIDNPLIPIQNFHDVEQYPFFQELVEEVQSIQWMDQVPTVDDYPGGSCGGVVLTPNKVLTNCACMRSFYTAHKLKQDVDFKEDYLFDIRADLIRLKFIDESLTAHVLDPDGSKMIDDSHCGKAIFREEPTDVLQTYMIAMPFSPSIPPPPTFPKDIYVGWPPNVLPDRQVNLVTYGMKPINPEWIFPTKTVKSNRFNFDETPTDFFMKKQDKPSDYCKIDPGKHNRLVCVTAANPGYQLMESEPGYPLTVDGQLFGLNCLPVSNGTTLVATFDEKIVKEIEDYVGKDNLHVTTAGPSTASVPTKQTAPNPTRPRNGVAALRQSSSSVIHIVPCVALTFRIACS